MIQWAYYPRSRAATEMAKQVVAAFESAEAAIDSSRHELKSNDVLAAVAPGLTKLGFKVETGKTTDAKIKVPVLFGLNGNVEQSFEADAHHVEKRFVIEVEAGRAVANHQFLKDLFQACMMYDVCHLAIAVRQIYRKSHDFDRVVRFFDTLYASRRLELPLEGVLIIGY